MNEYVSAAAEAEAPMLVLFELSTKLVGANGRYIALVAKPHGLIAVAERCGPACSSIRDIVETIAAAWEWNYSILPWFRKRSVLGKENFCLEVEVLREWLEVFKSTIELYYMQ